MKPPLHLVTPSDSPPLTGSGGLIDDNRTAAQVEAELGVRYRAAGREIAAELLSLIDRLHDACNRTVAAESLPAGVRDLADKLRRPLIQTGNAATAILERSK